MKTTLTLALLLVPLVGFPAQNRFGRTGQGMSGRGPQNCPNQAECPLNLAAITSPTTLPAAEIVAAFEAERVAHDLYTAAVEKWGSRVFTHIAAAELNHAAVLARLAAASAIALPAASRGAYSTNEHQRLYDQLLAVINGSETGALRAGALVEETDIADLRRLMGMATDPGTRAVLSNLERASVNHLSAFVHNLQMRGITYEPRVLTAEEYLALSWR
ncbi:MAG: DUF2202 domain-containing protein [Opitutaceae bacterium]|nr:DUF2202 domain-containing protein [Opitutaceae bacterium]